jgi:hypothetical protein
VGDLVVTVRDLIKQFMNTKWRAGKKRRNCGLKGDIYDGLIFPFKDTSRLGKWKSTRQVARDRRWRRFSWAERDALGAAPLITFFPVSHSAYVHR